MDLGGALVSDASLPDQERGTYSLHVYPNLTTTKMILHDSQIQYQSTVAGEVA